MRPVRALGIVLFGALLVGAGALLCWMAFPPNPPAAFDDPAELARTWDGARVRMPEQPATARLPVVIYLHGCAGFFPGTDLTLDFLAENGFGAVAPDSFARSARPPSCDLVAERGGLDRSVLALRHAEAAVFQSGERVA